MRDAIERGRDANSVAALVVGDDDVYAANTGEVFSRPDATAHSEVEAIREACARLDTVRLDGYWLYSTHEPCSMCMAACCWAHLDGVVYAATDEDMPDDWETVFAGGSAREIRDTSEHQPTLVEEFLRPEATCIHDARDE